MRRVVLTLVPLALSVGCAHRDAPYPFRGPLVSSVSAPDLRVEARRDRSDAWRSRRSRPRPVVRPRGGGAENRPPTRVAIASRPLETDEGLLTGESLGESLAERMRQMVGQRIDDGSDVDYALRVLAEVGAPLDDEIRGVESGRSLAAIARRRDAFAAEATPLLGDLIVFDDVVGRRESSLVGVVISTDSHGTVEFIYLARGVVRRGFVNPAYPSDKRDASGRVLNTFVRHSDGRDPPGTRYLAGELLGGFIRLDRLVPPS